MIATVSNRSVRSTVSVLVMLLVTASLTLVATSPLPAAEKGGYLDIYFIDVEGGAATLIVTPNNESVLIDTGNPGLRDSGRIAEVISKVAGLQSIDHLIVTHYHRDHYGGAEVLSTMLPIRT